MFLKFINIFLIVFICFAASHAFAASCLPHRPLVSLHASIKPIKYVRSFSSQNLTGFHYVQRQSLDNKVLGLAGGAVGTQFSANFEVLPVDDNLYCLQMKNLEVQFFARPTVHIARNFQRGSCEYSNILQHELKHIDILKKAHKDYVPDYKSYLRDISYGAPVLAPMSLRDVNREKDYLIDYLHQNVSEYITIMMQDVSERQKVIDTPEIYARDQAHCTQWDKKLKRTQR